MTYIKTINEWYYCQLHKKRMSIARVREAEKTLSLFFICEDCYNHKPFKEPYNEKEKVRFSQMGKELYMWGMYPKPIEECEFYQYKGVTIDFYCAHDKRCPRYQVGACHDENREADKQSGSDEVIIAVL